MTINPLSSTNSSSVSCSSASSSIPQVSITTDSPTPQKLLSNHDPLSAESLFVDVRNAREALDKQTAEREDALIKEYSLLETDEVDSLKQLFNSKNLFTHIHLDTIARETGYEGIDFQIILTYYLELFSTPFFKKHVSQDVYEKIIQFNDLFSQFQSVTHEISQDIQNKGIGINVVANKIMQNIINLPPKGMYALPGGYAGQPNKAHRMFYLFIKNEDPSFNLIIFNAQLDPNWLATETFYQKTKVNPVIYFEKIPVKALFHGSFNPHNERIKQLLLLQMRPIWQREIEYNNEHVFNLFYDIKNYIKRPPEDLFFFKTPQRSGTCSKKSFDMFLQGLFCLTFKKELGTKIFKELTFCSKLASLIAFYQHCHQSKPSFTTYFQLHQAAIHFSGRIRKDLEKPSNYFVPTRTLLHGLYTTCELTKNIDKYNKSKTRLIPADTELKAVISTAQEYENKVHDDHEDLRFFLQGFNIIHPHIAKERVRPILEIPDAVNSQNIASFLTNTLIHVKELDSFNLSNDVIHAILLVVNNLPIPSSVSVDDAVGSNEITLPPEPVKDLWDDIPLNEYESLIISLTQMGGIYTKHVMIKELYYVPEVHNASMTMIAIVLKLTNLKFPDLLKGYCLSTIHYEGLLAEDHQYIIENPQTLEKRNKLLKFFQKNPKDHSIFCFQKHLNITSQDEGILPDFLLYTKLGEKYPESMRTYEALLRKMYYQDADRGTNIAPLFYVKLMMLTDFGLNPNWPYGFLVSLGEEGPYLASLKQLLFASYFLMGAGEKVDTSVYTPNPTICYSLKFGKTISDNTFYCYDKKINSSSRKNPFAPQIFKPDSFLSTFQFRRKVDLQTDEEINANHYSSHIPFLPTENCFLSSREKYNSDKSKVEKLAALARVTCEPKIQTLALLQFLYKFIEFTNESEGRLYINKVLFKPIISKETEILPLSYEFQNDNLTQFWKLCTEVIELGLQIHFYGRPGRLPDLPKSLFIVRLATKLQWVYYLQTNKKPPEIIKNGHLLFAEWLSHVKIPDSEKATIHLHRIAQYMSCPPLELTTQDMISIISSWVYIQSSHQDITTLSEDKTFAFNVRQWVINIFPFIEKCIQANPDCVPFIYVSVFSELKMPLVQIKKTEINFPIIKITISEINDPERFWKINLVTGCITSDLGLLKVGQNSSLDHPNYKRLFEKRILQIKELGRHLYFVDEKYGEIKIEGGNFDWGIHRLINGVWHRYLPHDYFKSNFDLKLKYFPKALLTDYTHWIPEEKHQSQLGYTMYVEDLYTVKPYALWDNTGLIKRVSNISDQKDALELERVSLDVPGELISEVQQFEDPEYIEIWHRQNKPVLLEFPRYKTNSGSTLQFDHSDAFDVWMYKEDHNYRLVKRFQSHPIGKFSNYLLLQHIVDNHYKLLIPQLPFRSMGFSNKIKMNPPDDKLQRQRESLNFLVVDLVEDEVSPNSTESTLCVVLLHLLTKNYEQALNYLRKISTVETLSVKSTHLLNEIIISNDAAKDFSPSAAEVCLFACELRKNKSFGRSLDLDEVINPNSEHHKKIDDLYQKKLYKQENRANNSGNPNVRITCSIHDQSKSDVQDGYAKGSFAKDRLFNDEDFAQLVFVDDYKNNPASPENIYDEYPLSRFCSDYLCMRTGADEEKKALYFLIRLFKPPKLKLFPYLYFAFHLTNNAPPLANSSSTRKEQQQSLMKMHTALEKSNFLADLYQKPILEQSNF